MRIKKKNYMVTITTLTKKRKENIQKTQMIYLKIYLAQKMKIFQSSILVQTETSVIQVN